MISKDYTLGIDIGSTTVKVALLDKDSNIIFSDYARQSKNLQTSIRDNNAELEKLFDLRNIIVSKISGM